MIFLPNLEATNRLAAGLARLLRRGDIITLQGDLGAGKTTFVRCLLRSLGVTDDVPSPTFTLVQTYTTRDLPVYHFDLYRLKDSSELDELGFDDALHEGVALIEWSERAEARLTGNRLALHFSGQTDSDRQCSLQGFGNWAERLKGFA